MSTTLAFDFGNTRKKVAVFDGDIYREEIYLENDDVATIQKILKAYAPKASILSSVVHHDKEIEKVLSDMGKFHLVGSTTKLNFTSPVGKPETIGSDRLALMAAAAWFYPGKNNLIIALGSCITYNFMNQKAEFLGGGISPGMDMRFKAMHEHTALLPLVSSSWNIPLIGYDTKTNLQSGVLNGMAGEIAYTTELYAKKFGNFNAVLTGGNSAYFATVLKNKIFADYNFLFKGLYALSELNNGPL